MKTRIAFGAALSLALCACTGTGDGRNSIPANSVISTFSGRSKGLLHLRKASLPSGTWTALSTPACPSGYSFVTGPNDTTWSPTAQTGYVVGACQNDTQQYKYTAMVYKVSQRTVTPVDAYNDPGNPGNVLQAVQMRQRQRNGPSVYAVGYRSSPSGPTLIDAQYSQDGTKFKLMKCPNPGNQQNIAYGVYAFSSSNVLIAGTYTNFANGVLTGKTYLARWNGATCALISSPNPNSDNNEFLGIGASSTQNIWLVGLQGTSAYTPLCTLFNQVTSTFTQSTCPTGPGSFESELLSSVSVISRGHALADGYATGSGTGSGYEALNDYFNGRSWSYEYPEPIEGRFSDILADYGVLLIDSTHGWSVGQNQGLCQLGFWDGTAWSDFSCPQVIDASTNYFYGVAGNNSTALAGGVLSFNTPSGLSPIQVYVALYH
jgi:hypothetical protein